MWMKFKKRRTFCFAKKKKKYVPVVGKIKRIKADNPNQIQSAGKSLSQHNEQQTVRQLPD